MLVVITNYKTNETGKHKETTLLFDIILLYMSLTCIYYFLHQVDFDLFVRQDVVYWLEVTLLA